MYTKVTFLLYQLLIFLNRFVIYFFRPRGCKEKNSFTRGWLVTTFHFTRLVDRKLTTFCGWP